MFSRTNGRLSTRRGRGAAGALSGARGGGWPTGGHWTLVAASLLWALLCFAPAKGLAQQGQASLRIEPQVFGVGQRATARLLVEGQSFSSHPDLPATAGLVVVPMGMETAFGLARGRVSQSVTFTYQVEATAAGPQRLGPVKIPGGGSAPAVEVTVVAGGGQGRNGAPSPAPRGAAISAKDGLYARAFIEPESPWAGQSIVYTLEIGAAVRTGGIEWAPPEWGALAAEGGVEPERQERREVRDGRTWTVHSVSMPLFALSAGEFTIPAPTVTVDIPRSRGLFGVSEPVPVPANEVQVRVRDLPAEGRPSSWSGAVGHFEVQGVVEPRVVRAGETATRTVVVTGLGSTRGGRPRTAAVDGVRSYDEDPEAQLALVDRSLQGRWTWKQALVPMAPGALALPAAAFSWFDPTLGRYVEREVAPAALSVTGDAVAEARALDAPAAAGKQEVQVLGTDILPSHEAARCEGQGRPSPLAVPWVFGTLVPPLAALGLWAVRLRHRWAGGARAQAGARLREEREARREAERARATDDPLAVERALRRGVSARYGIGAASLTPAEVEAELVRLGAPSARAASLRVLLDRVEAARYGGGSTDGLADAMLEWWGAA